MPRRKNEPEAVDAKSIGQRLRQLRNRQGLTQVQMAEKVGLSHTLVSDYETGRLRMHAALVYAFAKALRVSADQILGLDRTKQDGHLNDRRFLRRLPRIGRLPERDKRHLLGTIDAVLRGSGIS